MSLNKGRIGEDMAAEYIEKIGMKIIDRNFRLPIGEIDIIAMDGDIIAFIEVKSRKTDKYGTPSEFVDLKKQKRILNTAEIYMKNNSLTELQPRFDICEIYSGKSEINYIENAFPK
ncbi:MAG: YraN family protein [Tissierellia bacterium]|nr:YraN family protein [Tissierellia bacterium]